MSTDENMKRSQRKILIVGAGPSGLMMACKLALHKIPFRLIDKKTEPSVHSNALIIHSKTLEIFAQMGLARQAIDQGAIVNAVSVYFNGKLVSRIDLRGIGNKVSRFPYILLLEQSKTEHLLRQFLQRAGYEPGWGTELTGLINKTDEVIAVLRSATGAIRKMSVPFLIAADGGKSTVRRALNIRFNGKTHNESPFIIECRSKMQLPPDEIRFLFSGSASAGLFPLHDGNVRIDASLQEKGFRKGKIRFEDVQKVFDSRIKMKLGIHNPGFFSSFHSRRRYAVDFRSNRCFLVGDAAHVHSPVGAQGMNNCLQDAHNLAWKLAFVMQNKLDPEILDTYQQERKPVARRTSLTTDRFYRLIASPGLLYRMLRMALLPALIRQFSRLLQKEFWGNRVFRSISGTGTAYGKNILCSDQYRSAGRKAPGPGERLPHFEYQTNGEKKNIRDRVHYTGFHLLVFRDRNADGTANMVNKYGGLITFEVIPPVSGTEDLYRAFGMDSGGWYLIRPDFYIAARSDERGYKNLEKYLQRIFCQL